MCLQDTQRPIIVILPYADLYFNLNKKFHFEKSKYFFNYCRGNTKGQTMTVAVAKWLGTLAPAILMGVLQSFNMYIVLTDIVCSVFDIIYIVQLSRFKKQEATQR